MATQYRINLAANWIAKYRRLKTSEAIPRHKRPVYSQLKASRVAKVDAGEDAFFHVSTPRNQYFGVADGVGSWEKSGIDPSHFSWSLMNNAHDIIRANLSSLSENIESDPPPVDLLEKAYEKIKQEKQVKAGTTTSFPFTLTFSLRARSSLGSSTASILKINKHTGILEAANLGDSAFVIVRDRNAIFYRSKEQQHFFNCPYQLSIHPENEPSRDGYIRDSPRDADVTRHQLHNNDLVVLATDGYFDNMFDEETISLIQSSTIGSEVADVSRFDLDKLNLGTIPIGLRERKTVEYSDLNLEGLTSQNESKVRRLSQRLAETARLSSMDSRRKTPWTNYVLANYPYHEAGG